MRSIRFDLQGFHRTYWDFFLASGFMVSIFFVFSAVLAWQFARVRPASGTSWAFATTFAAITVVSCGYLFVVPIAFSSLITVCLTVAAAKQ